MGQDAVLGVPARLARSSGWGSFSMSIRQVDCAVLRVPAGDGRGCNLPDGPAAAVSRTNSTHTVGFHAGTQAVQKQVMYVVAHSLHECSRQLGSQGTVVGLMVAAGFQGPRMSEAAQMSTLGHRQAGPQHAVADTAAARCISRCIQAQPTVLSWQQQGLPQPAQRLPVSTCGKRPGTKCCTGGWLDLAGGQLHELQPGGSLPPSRQPCSLAVLGVVLQVEVAPQDIELHPVQQVQEGHHPGRCQGPCEGQGLDALPGVQLGLPAEAASPAGKGDKSRGVHCVCREGCRLQLGDIEQPCSGWGQHLHPTVSTEGRQPARALQTGLPPLGVPALQGPARAS